jgi:hypothetical protein
VTRTLLAAALALFLAPPALAGGFPPSIQDLDGVVFRVRATGPDIDYGTGERSKFDFTLDWTVAMVDEETVSFDVVFGGMEFTAHYAGGILLQAAASSPLPAQEGALLYLFVSGSPGKLKLKGELTVYDTEFDTLRVLKVSGRELVPLAGER